MWTHLNPSIQVLRCTLSLFIFLKFLTDIFHSLKSFAKIETLIQGSPSPQLRPGAQLCRIDPQTNQVWDELQWMICGHHDFSTLTLSPRGAKRGPGGVLEPQRFILAKTLKNKSCWAPPIHNLQCVTISKPPQIKTQRIMIFANRNFLLHYYS